MAINNPGDALPCSIPQANAQKLQEIGAKQPVTGAPSAQNDDGSPAVKALAAAGRSVPIQANPPTGGQVDLHV